ncbi:hypothetical protein GOP47_0021931 [Adiantum capillus-veneris]|uniref:CST complex subunit CTC1 n=1 Tax=Adiantum capillus-veneris TaxID=13818 RepID=A0A9D4Z6N3_ADICA|nr:hypothetical protein GOP47_0021931 [Adiantum capillus-veneris]
MESSSPGEKTVTVQEILQRQSPLSVHHHISSRTGCAGNQDRFLDFSSALEKESGFSGVSNKRQCISSSKTIELNSDTGHLSSTGRKNQHMLGRKPSCLRSQTALLQFSEQPCVLFGWIQLWNGSAYEANSLAFSDFSGTICCAVTEFDPQLLGLPMRILSWSYIPQREKGGCLEIRHFVPMQTSKNLPRRSVYVCPEAANVPNLVLETPPSKQNIRALRHNVTGCINFVSPPFSIPHGECRTKHASELTTTRVSRDSAKKSTFCKKGAQMLEKSAEPSDLSSFNVASSIVKEKPLLGFFVGFSPCNHKPSCLPPRMDHCGMVESVAAYGDYDPYKQQVSYIYFSGSVVAWRPLLLATSGKCVLLTSLRKKILVAKEAGIKYNIYAATRISSVLLCNSSNIEKFKTRDNDKILQTKSLVFSKDFKQHNRQCLRQQNEIGSYVGVVTEIFVRGGLLELDGHVWLLLTHQPLSHIPGLRVGATITALHVHFLRVTSFLENGLLLAACSISHLVVTQFSPLQTEYAGKQKSVSCLVRFVESLPFLSTFWALQVIASLRRKFQDLYTEKELLGSAKSMGIAEKYLRDLLTVDNIHCRNVFGEFFSHRTSCSLAKTVPFNCSMQVPPIKNFCKQLQAMWLDRSSWFWNWQRKSINRGVEIFDHGGQKGDVFIRRVISSRILGWTILGFLQFSSVLGKLQLLDATGVIDVIIPDLQTAEIPQGACQVTAYKLVIEGYLGAPTNINLDPRRLPLSWYSLLKGTSCSLEASENVSFFLIFSIKEACMVPYIRHLGSASDVQHLSPLSMIVKEDTCTFDILLVIHKHPMKLKAFGKQTGDNSFTFSVEAVRLPYKVCTFKEQRKSIKTEEAAGMLHSSMCTISVLSLSDFFNMSKKGTDRKGEDEGYTSYPCLFTRTFPASNLKVERLLFRFTDKFQAAFQVIEIGQLYLVQSLRDPAARTMYIETQFWSLVAIHDYGWSAEADKVPKNVLLENDSSLPLVNAILKLPLTFQSEFSSCLKDARALLSCILSIREVIKHGKSLIHRENVNGTRVLKGALLSFYGTIGTSVTGKVFSLRTFYSSFGEGGKRFRTFSIQDLNSCESIMVACNLDQYLPVGFGSGAVVAIHRALLHLSVDGEVSIECIPSTLIEVWRLGEDSFMGKLDCLTEMHWHQDECKTWEKEQTMIDSIFQLSHINSSVPKSFKICCRVVSVEKLLIERNEPMNNVLIPPEVAIYNVGFALLTLDDGSGLAKCSAQGEAAASLLKMPGLNSGQNGRTSKNTCLISRLNAIVTKYKKVLYCSMDSQQDTLSNTFMVHGAEGETLDFAERKFMHAVVIGACHAGLLDIVAELPTHENESSKVWEDQGKDMQNTKEASELFIVAKKVGSEAFSSVSFWSEIKQIAELHEGQQLRGADTDSTRTEAKLVAHSSKRCT